MRRTGRTGSVPAAKYLLVVAVTLVGGGLLVASLSVLANVGPDSTVSALGGVLIAAPLLGLASWSVGSWTVGVGTQTKTVTGCLLATTSLLCFLAASAAELRFPLYPEIDTRIAPQYTDEGFAAVAAGMTLREVYGLVGEPLHGSPYVPYGRSRTVADPDVILQYAGDGACAWGDFAWHARDIAIHQGVVLWKAEGWRYD